MPNDTLEALTEREASEHIKDLDGSHDCTPENHGKVVRSAKWCVRRIELLTGSVKEMKQAMDTLPNEIADQVAERMNGKTKIKFGKFEAEGKDLVRIAALALIALLVVLQVYQNLKLKGLDPVREYYELRHPRVAENKPD